MRFADLADAKYEAELAEMFAAERALADAEARVDHLDERLRDARLKRNEALERQKAARAAYTQARWAPPT